MCFEREREGDEKVPAISRVCSQTWLCLPGTSSLVVVVVVVVVVVSCSCQHEQGVSDTDNLHVLQHGHRNFRSNQPPSHTQYTDTRPTSPNTDPMTPVEWQDHKRITSKSVLTRLGKSGDRPSDLTLSKRTPFPLGQCGGCPL